MNYTIAKMREPNAKDPKWYLNALYKLLDIALWAPYPVPYEKYQIQQAEAITKSLTANSRALVHNPPNTKYHSIYIVSSDKVTVANGLYPSPSILPNEYTNLKQNYYNTWL